MIFSFRSLHLFFTQSVSPVSLLDRNLSGADFKNWKTFLNDEGQNLRLAMKEHLPGPKAETDKKNSLSAIQRQLVLISDELNAYLFRERKVWATHNNADLIKEHYLYSLSFIEDILNFASANFQEYYDSGIKLTDFRLKNIVPELRHDNYELKNILNEAGIPSELVLIVLKALNNMLLSKRLSPTDIRYLIHLVKEIRTAEGLNEEGLMSILIKCNFNLPELFIYKANSVASKLVDINGLHEQIELLLQLREELNAVEVAKDLNLYPRQATLKEDLNGFFTEKVVYMEELLSLRRVAITDKYESEKAFRLLVRLSVPQLALFFRVLMEKGVLAKEGLGEVFNFVAHHFYTEKTVFISSQNMLIKSSNVEFSNALKLWDILMGMADWLDEKYSVRNYQR